MTKAEREEVAAALEALAVKLEKLYATLVETTEATA
jgi:hypothetical protein